MFTITKIMAEIINIINSPIIKLPAKTLLIVPIRRHTHKFDKANIFPEKIANGMPLLVSVFLLIISKINDRKKMTIVNIKTLNKKENSHICVVEILIDNPLKPKKVIAITIMIIPASSFNFKLSSRMNTEPIAKIINPDAINPGISAGPIIVWAIK